MLPAQCRRACLNHIVAVVIDQVRGSAPRRRDCLGIRLPQCLRAWWHLGCCLADSLLFSQNAQCPPIIQTAETGTRCKPLLKPPVLDQRRTQHKKAKVQPNSKKAFNSTSSALAPGARLEVAAGEAVRVRVAQHDARSRQRVRGRGPGRMPPLARQARQLGHPARHICAVRVLQRVPLTLRPRSPCSVFEVLALVYNFGEFGLRITPKNYLRTVSESDVGSVFPRRRKTSTCLPMRHALQQAMGHLVQRMAQGLAGRACEELVGSNVKFHWSRPDLPAFCLHAHTLSQGPAHARAASQWSVCV